MESLGHASWVCTWTEKSIAMHKWAELQPFRIEDGHKSWSHYSWCNWGAQTSLRYLGKVSIVVTTCWYLWFVGDAFSCISIQHHSYFRFLNEISCINFNSDIFIVKNLLLSTVNVASRMESTGKAGAIQVTQETCEILQTFGYSFEQRGLVAVKGKGQLMTYYLLVSVCIGASQKVSNRLTRILCFILVKSEQRVKHLTAE